MERPLFFEHLDLAANAFNLSNPQAAALQLEKALKLVTERTTTDSSPHPYSTGIWPELRKSVDALGARDLGVSATCLSKALDQVTPVNLDHTVAIEHGRAIVLALRQENYTSIASQLREVSSVLDRLGQLATAGVVG